jgi:hypothetical protein
MWFSPLRAQGDGTTDRERRTARPRQEGLQEGEEEVSRLRLRRPRHATIVAYLALFVALGGSSYALTVGSEDVPKNELTGQDIQNLTVNDFKGQDLPATRVVIGPQVTVGANGNAVGTIGCADGSPTGGGYIGNGIAAHVAGSIPLGNQGWLVQVEGAPQGASFKTYVVCSQ